MKRSVCVCVSVKSKDNLSYFSRGAIHLVFLRQALLRGWNSSSRLGSWQAVCRGPAVSASPACSCKSMPPRLLLKMCSEGSNSAKQ